MGRPRLKRRLAVLGQEECVSGLAERSGFPAQEAEGEGRASRGGGAQLLLMCQALHFVFKQLYVFFMT